MSEGAVCLAQIVSATVAGMALAALAHAAWGRLRGWQIVSDGQG